IFVTKAVMVFTLFGNPELPPCLYDGRLLAALAGAASCCAEDVSVGLGCLLLGGLALCWRPRLVMPCLYIAALAALVLLAVDAHLFAHLRCFLNGAHLEAVGGLNMERSVSDAATPAVRLTLVAVPLLPLALHLAVARAWPRFWLAGARLLLRPVPVLALVL